MAAIIEVKYFNSFVLKKSATAASTTTKPVWNGSFGIPESIGGFPAYDDVSNPIENDTSWFVEEARIRGGYNNTSTDYGVRAYLVEEEPNANFRLNSMIYSGIYNSRTGINQTNVFSVSENITKSLDPANGSIQKLYAEDTNLIIFQESKVSRALIDKDAIYSAEGGGLPVSSFTTVIGQIVPYNGNYGIGNHPESFAVYGYNKYFVDSYQNSVMRLGADGLTEISATGMRSFFRNKIVSVDSVNFGKGKILGGFDVYNKDYIVSIQPSSPNISYNTLSYDESARGWISRYSYKPSQSFSLKNNHYTTFGDGLYLHNSTNVPYNQFYNTSNASEVTFVFNPRPGNSKVFNTISYEGTNGWQVDSFVSDETGPSSSNIINPYVFDKTNNVLSYTEGAYDSAVPPNTGTSATVQPIFRVGFDRKENKYCANVVNNTPVSEGEIVFGNQVSGIKGYYAVVKMSTDTVTEPGRYKELFMVGSNYTFSNGY